MSNIERYNQAKEKFANWLKVSSLLYEYLGDPKDHIDYFNEEDYDILQERLVELQR